MHFNRKRYCYFGVFSVVFLAEILIALFVRDSFIRPYGGDILVTVLICAFVRMIFPEKIKLLPIWVTLFAFAVEIGQYFDFVKLIGLQSNAFFSVLLGRTFSFADMICYAVGCIIFGVCERVILSRSK